MAEVSQSGVDLGVLGTAVRDTYWTKAFGVSFRSDTPLPELDPATPCNDYVDILKADLGLEAGGYLDDDPRVERAGEVVRLTWPALVRFEVHAPSRILYQLQEGSEVLFRLPLLGVVFATLLQMRSRLVLHASSAAFDDEAVIFLGDKGAGKSTTAAACVQAGHALLTDDIVALDLGLSGPVQVLPGYGQIKLTRSSSAAIHMLGAEVLPSPHEAFDKHQHRLNTDKRRRATPNRYAYVLERGAALAIKPMGPGEALSAILQNTYVARFGDLILSGPRRIEHFRQTADYLRRVQVMRLIVPEDLGALEQLVAMIAAHVRAA